MKTLKILPFVSILIGTSFAADEYTFWHKGLAEQATDIVLVTEGLKIDGSITVLATYKGDVAPGSKINIPQLIEFEDSARRITASATHARRKNNPVHKKVTGNVMILFLVNDGNKLTPPKFTGDTWIYWIEGDLGYARIQENNPGKSLIREYRVPLETVLLDITKKQNKSEMATPRKPSD